MKRDNTVDILRGLAIVTMVFANFLPYALKDGYPYWIRFIGTFAAPMFILLSGLSITITASKEGHNFRYYLRRGVNILLVSGLVDLALWGDYPFVVVDVLMLIGIAIPICYGYHKLQFKHKYLIIPIIFLVSLVLKNVMGYRPEIMAYGITDVTLYDAFANSNVLNRLIVDGWFPLFPWVGYALLGVTVGEIRKATLKKHNRKILIGALTSFIVGTVIWNMENVTRYIREDYSELFYPPTLSFILVSVGVILASFVIVDYIGDNLVGNVLSIFGKCSMFMYILHTAVAAWVLTPYFKYIEKLSYGKFFVFIGLSLVLFLGVCKVHLEVKKIKIKVQQQLQLSNV